MVEKGLMSFNLGVLGDPLIFSLTYFLESSIMELTRDSNSFRLDISDNLYCLCIILGAFLPFSSKVPVGFSSYFSFSQE